MKDIDLAEALDRKLKWEHYLKWLVDANKGEIKIIFIDLLDFFFFGKKKKKSGMGYNNLHFLLSYCKYLVITTFLAEHLFLKQGQK